MWIFMDYNEAQQVFFEVLEVFENTELDTYSILEVKANTEAAVGYNVLIKAFLWTVYKQQVYGIAKKHGLKVKEEKEGFTLYKPRYL